VLVCYKTAVSDLPRSVDVAIVGGGFAGMATAWWLARKMVRDVIVLERESQLGAYASGRAAGIGRQLTEDDLSSALTVVGAAHLRAFFPQAWKPTGGLLSFEDMEIAKGYLSRAQRLSVDVVKMTRRGVTEMWPQLASLQIEAALHVPSDGIIDIAAFLEALADGRRVEKRTGVERIEAGGRGARLVTTRGTIEARFVVDATGAWAGRTTNDPPLESLKRHVYVLDAKPTAAPFVWHIGSRELYLRADGERVLVSPCDATPVSAGDQKPDAQGEALLRARLEGSPLADAPIHRAWACQRTFARGMQLGRDSTRPWLIWAVGLGGHGATAASAVGEIVANAVIDGL